MTSLVTNETTAVALYTAPEGGWASDGNEDAVTRYPMVKMVHGTSRMTDDAPKHAGEFYHDDSGEFTPSVTCVALFRRDTRALFVTGSETPACRSFDGKRPEPDMDVWNWESVQFRGMKEPMMVPHGEPSSCASCVFGEWQPGRKPPLCKSSIVLLIDRKDGGLAQLQFSGKSIRPYNELVGKIRARGHRLYFYELELTTVRRTEGDNTWYELAPIKATPLPTDRALEYNELILSQRPKFETAEVHVDDEEVPSAFMAELTLVLSAAGLHPNSVAKYMKANFTEANVTTFMANNGLTDFADLIVAISKSEHGGFAELPFE